MHEKGITAHQVWTVKIMENQFYTYLKQRYILYKFNDINLQSLYGKEST